MRGREFGGLRVGKLVACAHNSKNSVLWGRADCDPCACHAFTDRKSGRFSSVVSVRDGAWWKSAGSWLQCWFEWFWSVWLCSGVWLSLLRSCWIGLLWFQGPDGPAKENRKKLVSSDGHSRTSISGKPWENMENIALTCLTNKHQTLLTFANEI